MTNETSVVANSKTQPSVSVSNNSYSKYFMKIYKADGPFGKGGPSHTAAQIEMHTPNGIKKKEFVDYYPSSHFKTSNTDDAPAITDSADASNVALLKVFDLAKAIFFTNGGFCEAKKLKHEKPEKVKFEITETEYKEAVAAANLMKKQTQEGNLKYAGLFNISNAFLRFMPGSKKVAAHCGSITNIILNHCKTDIAPVSDEQFHDPAEVFKRAVSIKQERENSGSIDGKKAPPTTSLLKDLSLFNEGKRRGFISSGMVQSLCESFNCKRGRGYS